MTGRDATDKLTWVYVQDSQVDLRTQASIAKPSEEAGSSAVQRRPERKLVAPLWHTFVLLLIFAALAAIGLLNQSSMHGHAPSPAHVRLVPIQLQAIAFEWLTLAFAWIGLRLKHVRLRDIVGGRWSNTRSVLVDLTLAVAISGTWVVVGQFVSRYFGRGQDAIPFPSVPLEAGLAVGVALSAAICEEIVFRGYFQQQFRALAGNLPTALVAQGAVFGIAHVYQGTRTAVTAGLYGLLFGVVAIWRRSLRPGIVAHALSDISARLFQF